MKKIPTLLALFCGLPSLTQAQSNVTFYGYLDAAIASERGAAAGSVTKLASSVATPARLGFRGEEDLGSGLSAIYNLEMGIALDTGATTGASLFGRTDFVGLRGPLGTIRMGNIRTVANDTLCFVADPMQDSYAGQAGNMMTSGVVGGARSPGGRGNFRGNTVAYTSPVIGGVNAELDYSFGEAAEDSAKNRTIGASLGYGNGTLTTRLAYLSTTDAAGLDSANNILLAAHYNFGVATGYLAYGRNKGYANVDNREILIGASLPVKVGKVMLSYIRKDDKSAVNNDGHQAAVAYVYPLSKRSAFFTSYARISQRASNTSPAFYSINVGAPGLPGGGDRAFNVGMSHTF
jgi:predicted porin